VTFSTLETVRGVVYKLNVGYLWMLINCLTSATYVNFSRYSRLSLVLTEYHSGSYHAKTNKGDWIFGFGLDVLQQFIVNTSPRRVLVGC